MSSSEGPIRRRRIAGESTPGRAASETPRAKAKKGPAAKPGVKKTPAAKSGVAKKAPAKKVSIRKAEVSDSTDNTTATKPAITGVVKPGAKTAQLDSVSRQTADAAAPIRATPRDLRVFVPVALLAIAALVLGGFLLAKGIGEHRGGGDVTTAQEQAAEAASVASETIFSFRYDKLPDHLRDAKAIMTPAFAEEFDKIAPALTDLAPQRKIVVQAAARNAAAIDCGASCSPDKANILVFVDQARLVSGSDQPTVFGNRITVSMVKTDGVWLVSDIRAL